MGISGNAYESGEKSEAAKSSKRQTEFTDGSSYPDVNQETAFRARSFTHEGGFSSRSSIELRDRRS